MCSPENESRVGGVVPRGSSIITDAEKCCDDAFDGGHLAVNDWVNQEMDLDDGADDAAPTCSIA